jgi:hypothetical protein
MDVPEVRRRVRAAIARARDQAQRRRARMDNAARDYDVFLAGRAVPVFHTFAAALVAEGLRFNVSTPAGSVRLGREGGAEDYIELLLDTAGDLPMVMGRSSRGRGSRLVTEERPLKEGAEVSSLTEEDVLDYLGDAIVPFVAAR